MGIKELRRLEEEYPELYANVVTEYSNMRTRDFCNRYGI
jgi:hypothetical protein